MTNSSESLEQRLAAIEVRIQGMDDEFSRRTNLLLDEILVAEQQRAEMDRRLTERLDRLAASQQLLAENQQALQATLSQTTTFMVQLARVATENQAEIRRIWEYLLRQSGNGNQPPRT
jgi:hypothetical protein